MPDRSPSRASSRHLGLWAVLVVVLAIAGGQVAGVVDLPADTPMETTAVPTAGTVQDTAQPGDAATRANSTSRSATPTRIPTTTATGAGEEAAIDASELERLVHQEINERRTQHGLSTLDRDAGLREIARYHSRDMARNDYFAHTAPDGETMGDRYDRFGYDCRVDRGDGYYATGAENIYAFRFGGSGPSEAALAERVVDGWMNSEGHRRNVLRDYWENEGIGVAVVERDGVTTVYVTQNFC
ncbi:CAP domain-containing protein [Haloarchaeobius amylolyticus]|uniref:CAP domain-containing protein n=1 Tax=Haloarchaeobius amylolyticus TaxID=1198296 RepID=UPI00226E4B3E|nr:CAP domain-containing protein [Haloarchaeobius amylolyticus]